MRPLTVCVCGVGGGLFVVLVRQLARRLAARAHDVRVEETHGMAQRGGRVTALIEADLRDAHASRGRTVLLGLERIEGARALGALRADDLAFIARGSRPPPGPHAGVPPPTDEELHAAAARLGVHLVLVDATPSDPSRVVQAALDAAAIP